MEVNPKKKKFMPSIETRVLVDELLKLEPGQTLTYADAEEITGVNLQVKRYIYVSAMHTLQREHSVVVHIVHKVGFRRAENQDIPGLAYGTLKTIGKRSRRELKRLHCADYGTLPEQEKLRYNTSGTLLSLSAKATNTTGMKQIEAVVGKKSRELVLKETLQAFLTGGTE